MSSDPAPAKKKTRAGGSRSRSGCHTCRVRRVKCDEGKPGCVRCQKFGRPCDGYEVQKISTPPSTPKSHPSSSSISLPTRNRDLLPLTVASVKHVSHLPPITLTFQDESEEQYFRFFYTETASGLAGGVDNVLWSRIVLQACNEEPCILYCAVALAALDKTCKTRALSGTTKTAEIHHQYALQKYGKALKGLQDVLSRGENFVRTALIASILIFSFENFHGDMRLALTHAQSAVEVMRNWLARNLGPGLPTGFSPAPDIIEDELVFEFAAMEMHLTTWMKPQRPNDKRIQIQGTSTSQAMIFPLQFNGYLEAKNQFDYLANRAFLYLESGTKIKPQDTMSKLPEMEHGTVSTQIDIGDEIRQWLAAFEPVLSEARTPEGDGDFIPAAILKSHAVGLDLLLRAAAFESTKAHLFDVFLPEYCEVVALCREVVSHPSFIKGFVFDAGIVPNLFGVVTHCRDPMVRREALDVLRQAVPRREGVWDSLMTVRIGEQLLREEGDGKSEEVNVREWVEEKSRCLSTTLELPKVKDEEDPDQEVGSSSRSGRVYLLDWIERCMRGRYTVCGSTEYYE